MIEQSVTHLLAFALGALFVLAMLFAFGVRAMWSLAKPAIGRAFQEAQAQALEEERAEKALGAARPIHDRDCRICAEIRLSRDN